MIRLSRPMTLAFWLTALLGFTGGQALAQSASPPSVAVPPGICSSVAEALWLNELTARASAYGDCASTRITLQVRTPEDEIVWAAVYPARDLFGFADIGNGEDMAQALIDWMSTNVTQGTSADLPAWREGEALPDSGEFPFYVVEGVEQPFYEALRAEKRQMICYVQGMESYLCLGRHPESGQLQVLGYQSFPG